MKIPQRQRAIVARLRARMGTVMLRGCLSAALCAVLGACSSPRVQASLPSKAADPALDLSGLPEASIAAPVPWQPYVTELALGATRCPGAPSIYEGQLNHGTLHRPCFGLIPRPLAEVVRDIPVADIHLPAAVRVKYLRQPQHYLAMPGFGERPDYMAHVGARGTWFVVRSFEGKDPADTVYFVEGPFICMDEAARNRLEFDGGYDELEAGDCPLTFRDHRLYRRRADGRLQDVTRALLPRPVIPRGERHKYSAGSPRLDSSQLSYAPTFRWRASPPGEEPFPESEPRRYDGVVTFDAHFGFAVWNGKAFDQRDRVSDALWPRWYCSLSRPDFKCDGELTRGRRSDPFLDYDTDWPTRRTP